MESSLARNYDGFREMLNDRRIQLRLSMLELDHLAHLPSGYSSKILSGTRKKGTFSAIGRDTMGKLLSALSIGIRLEPVSDGSGFSRGEKPDLPHLRLWRQRSRKAGLKAYGQMNSIERGKFARAGGIASGIARRRASAQKKKRAARCGKNLGERRKHAQPEVKWTDNKPLRPAS
jgi:hypothetical protein